MAASPGASAAMADTGRTKRDVGVTGVADLLVDALAAHRLGQLDSAAQLYGEVLELAPDNPDALHLLGVVRHQSGDSADAVELIGRAIALDGSRAIYHANRATALQHLGQVAEAMEGYRQALALDPVNADANGNLGHLLKDLGEDDEATWRYEESIRFQPRVRSVHKHLASLYLDKGRVEDAADLFRRYLDAFPDDAEAQSNYGLALDRLERPEEALPHYRRAQELAPDSPEICSNLGNALKRLGRREEAAPYFAKAAALAPENVGVLHNHMVSLLEDKNYPETIAVLRRLIELKPDNASYHNDLGTCLSRIGRTEEGLGAFLKADALAPGDPNYLANLGTALLNVTRYAEAAEVFESAIAATKKGSALLSANLCMALRRAGLDDKANINAHAAMEMPGWEPRMALAVAGPFRSTCDFEGIEALGDLIALCDEHLNPENLMGAFLDLRPLTEDLETDRRLTALHLKWGDSVMSQATSNPLPPLPATRRKGRVRIGFLSSDLRSHAVAKFAKTVFDRFDRDRYEVYGYTQFDLPSDPVQVDLKRKATGFRFTAQMSDREVAQAIRADDIDVLFELNAATQHSQLAALAWRAAPVQVSWLGYGATTGLRAIDYALVDRFVKPTEPGLWVEQFIEMKGAWVCFTDYPEAPIADALPLERNGAVTFGTMNAAYKVTPAMIALWARIMHAVPGSRMLFVRPEFRSLTPRANIAKEFVKHDIPSGRIFFIANRPGQFNHLEHYNEIDVSLDTYPAVGGTTSCDTMWMGVPIVGRYGPNMHQRLNHALVNHCGLGDLSVATPEAYFETAVALANDVPRLKALRHGLRDRVKASPIYDVEGFVRDFQDRVDEMVAQHGLR